MDSVKQHKPRDFATCTVNRSTHCV